MALGRKNEKKGPRATLRRFYFLKELRMTIDQVLYFAVLKQVSKC